MKALAGVAKILDSKSALVAVSIIVASSALFGFGKVDAEVWKEMTLWTGLGYIGGEKLRDSAAAFREGAKKATK